LDVRRWTLDVSPTFRIIRANAKSNRPVFRATPRSERKGFIAYICAGDPRTLVGQIFEKDRGFR
jgi:hypothetical protein